MVNEITKSTNHIQATHCTCKYMNQLMMHYCLCTETLDRRHNAYTFPTGVHSDDLYSIAWQPIFDMQMSSHESGGGVRPRGEAMDPDGNRIYTPRH